VPHLLGYLGGAVGADVLRSDLSLSTASTADGGTVCTVGWTDGSLTGSQRGVLTSPAGDDWRRCRLATGSEVPCSERHTAEVVFDRSDTQDQTAALNCEARAGQYVGRPFDQVADELKAVEDGGQCVVEVRGDNVLTASLRNLRSNALPIEAG
jgi:hypothetical protein